MDITTQVPLHPLEQALLSPAHEQQTAPLEASLEESITNSLPLLDHRTRSRTIPERRAPRGHYLAFKDGVRTRLLPLSRVTHLGRGLSSEVRIEQQQISRSHAIVVLHGRYARLLDNRSSNGTFVGDRRIVATNLLRGDLISLGPVAMRYVIVD